MGRKIMGVVRNGQLVGYTRWNHTADVLDTHAIARTAEEAWQIRHKSEEIPPRRHTDVLVTLVWLDRDYKTDTWTWKTGWNVWANEELTFMADTGGWYVNDGCGGDFGYTDVDKPDNPNYTPIPVEDA